ncbi:MAG: rRNA cytosine-C5-methyltransferase [Actinobacteria bacterium]|nr:MAG: rRNA cytosine-C5-methyltransferase [Actinomycetota bacterium]
MTERATEQVTERQVAVDVLVRVDEGAYANLLLPARLRASDLDARACAFATDLVYGTLREQRRIDALWLQHSHRPADHLDARTRAAVRLGTYQLLHGVASHAAVGETVEVAPERARGFVNAVLRAVAAAGPPWPEPDDLATELSYPDWIVDRLSAELGADDAHAALRTMNTAPSVALRPSASCTTVEELDRELRAHGVDVEAGHLVPHALLVRGAGDLARLPAVAEGRATPQDEASQAIIDLVGAEPGARVADLAAGPGGKATGLAERVGSDGVVFAGESNPRRLQLVVRAADRLGLAAAIAPVLADGRSPPIAPGSCDAVLVDAPCTGLGVLRRRPEARWRIDESQIEPLSALQRDLLVGGASAVRRGGRLVYSVCTLTAEETLGVAAWVSEHLTDFVPLPRPEAPWRPAGHGALLLPQDAGTDGMFVARWERVR